MVLVRDWCRMGEINVVGARPFEQIARIESLERNDRSDNRYPNGGTKRWLKERLEEQQRNGQRSTPKEGRSPRWMFGGFTFEEKGGKVCKTETFTLRYSCCTYKGELDGTVF